MIQRANEILESLRKAVEAAGSLKEMSTIYSDFLGRKGRITRLAKSIGQLPLQERPEAGKKINRIKREGENLFNKKKERLSALEMASVLQGEAVDISAPGIQGPWGSLHPVTQVQYELEEIFTSMGFAVLEGPEVETEYYNFEALNIPEHHPARDMQDTFWLEDGNLLRTHTSPVQIRAMERMKPPIRAIAPGRCFRYEASDASHENSFYQVEGLMIDRDISVANLISVMKILLRSIFRREVTIRLRPGYFPFVEPGFELDMNCEICGGRGCSVCKNSGWVELLPCGLVHPNVLRFGGIDPEEYSGFAFGLGLTRLVMMRYGIDDIRHFFRGDLRFLEQF